MINPDAPLLRLRRAGQDPKRALLDQVIALGPAVVPALIEMATDERLHNADGDSPEVWAPIHAVRLLGELGAPEAVEPLLPLFSWEDDYLDTDLPECFGRIGQSALEPLRALLFEPADEPWAAGRAAHGLKEIAERHPELRADAVAALVERLDVPEPKTPEDETLNGFVISYLCDLEAAEAMPSIRRAFLEDRVDQFVIGRERVEDALGVPIGLSVAEAIEGSKRPTVPRILTGGVPAEPSRPAGQRPGRWTNSKVPRNAPCPCGSGRKFKKCCGR